MSHAAKIQTAILAIGIGLFVNFVDRATAQTPSQATAPKVAEPTSDPKEVSSAPAKSAPAPGGDRVESEAGSSRQSGVSVVANERFSEEEGKAGLCDVYCPDTEPPASGHPTVIVVHGGAWISGDKWTLEGYSRNLAKNGFVAVTINYRLAPRHKFPAQVDDVRCALLWAKKNAERFAIDINRLGMFGYSAGGHLSALVASLANESVDVRAAASAWDVSDERWQQLPPIRAVCAGGPPCDFRSLHADNPSLSFFLGGSRRQLPEVYVAASPAAHVSAGDPVTQLIHGESDLLVPISESRQFHELQQAAGIDSRIEIIPKQGHMLTFLNPKTNTKVGRVLPGCPCGRRALTTGQYQESTGDDLEKQATCTNPRKSPCWGEISLTPGGHAIILVAPPQIASHMTPRAAASIRLAAIRMSAFMAIMGSLCGTTWAGLITKPVDLDLDPNVVVNVILADTETPAASIRTGNSLSCDCDALATADCQASAISGFCQWISPQLVRYSARPHDATTLYPRLMEILKVPIESATFALRF